MVEKIPGLSEAFNRTGTSAIDCQLKPFYALTSGRDHRIPEPLSRKARLRMATHELASAPVRPIDHAAREAPDGARSLTLESHRKIIEIEVIDVRLKHVERLGDALR